MKDRMKLFIKLVCKDNNVDKELMNSYNNHYSEVYSFFNIVTDCLIELDDIDYFDIPRVNDDSFTIIFTLNTKESVKILKEYISKNSVVNDTSSFELSFRSPVKSKTVELTFRRIS